MQPNDTSPTGPPSGWSGFSWGGLVEAVKKQVNLQMLEKHTQLSLEPDLLFCLNGSLK